MPYQFTPSSRILQLVAASTTHIPEVVSQPPASGAFVQAPDRRPAEAAATGETTATLPGLTPIERSEPRRPSSWVGESRAALATCVVAAVVRTPPKAAMTSSRLRA